MKGSTEKITSDVFVSRLRDLMEDAKLTQKELADRLDIGQSTVSSWLAGNRPKPKSLRDLAEFFRVAPRWLAGGEGPRAAIITSEPKMIMREDAAGVGPTRQKCLEHLEKFLATCDEDWKVGWTYGELTGHFPLDKWRSHGASSTPVSGEEQSAIREAERQYERESQARGPSRKAGGPSGEKSEPSTGTSPESKGKLPLTLEMAPRSPKV